MYFDIYSFSFGAISASWMYFVWKYLSRKIEVPEDYSSSDEEVSSSEEESSSEESDQMEFISSLEKCFDKVTHLMNTNQLETFLKLKDGARNCFAEKDPKEFIKKATTLLKEIENIEVENVSANMLRPKPSQNESVYDNLEVVSYATKYAHLVGMSYKNALEEVVKDDLTMSIANYSSMKALPGVVWVTIEDPEFDLYNKTPSENAKIVRVY